MSAEPEAGAFRPPRFDVAVEEADGTVVLRLSGELDLVSEPILAAALERAKGRPMRIEMAELAFMDSTGLRALLSAAREYPDLKLAGPLQAPVRRLLDLTQTHAILPFNN
ncbi:MAG TPA: STAS domain-containing protein [Solirubrobacter sp.]|nr:STAS domain-containing protein [Solirubrobacter sp.]